MNTQAIKREIKVNACEIRRLHAQIHETVKQRNQSPELMQAWEKACNVFYENYSKLAFPGGFHGAFERILDGDVATIEAAICFLEVRPYFFRSGYMFKDIIRKLKRADLTPKHARRFDYFLQRYEIWREKKQSKDLDSNR